MSALLTVRPPWPASPAPLPHQPPCEPPVLRQEVTSPSWWSPSDPFPWCIVCCEPWGFFFDGDMHIKAAGGTSPCPCPPAPALQPPKSWHWTNVWACCILRMAYRGSGYANLPPPPKIGPWPYLLSWPKVWSEVFFVGGKQQVRPNLQAEGGERTTARRRILVFMNVCRISFCGFYINNSCTMKNNSYCKFAPSIPLMWNFWLFWNSLAFWQKNEQDTVLFLLFSMALWSK